MSEKTYRVIQWATGTVGKIALKHFIENPTTEVVGVLVFNPDKVGQDVGEIVGLPPIGVAATGDVEAILALEADCVHFAPLVQDVDMVCRLLRSGKNVVSTIGPFYHAEAYQAQIDQIDAAAKEGGVTFHGCGIYPGYIGDILPLTLTRLMDRVDHIQIYEIADKKRNPSVYIESMGFGQTPEELASKPNVMEGTPIAFSQAMGLVVEGLGKKIEKLTDKHELAIADVDISYPGGVIKAGTVAGQHWEITTWTDGKPIMTYHLYYTMGQEGMTPAWGMGDSRYRIDIQGNPSLQVTLMAEADNEGRHPFLGIDFTALLGTTAVAAVCGAQPGFATHDDLGVVHPSGLVRR